MKYLFPALLAASLFVSCQKSPRDLVAQGLKLAANGKSEEAAIEFRKAIQLDANQGEAHYQLGLLSLQNGDGDAALASLTNAARLLPDREEVQVSLANLYVEALRRNPEQSRFSNEIQRISTALLARNPKSFDGLRLAGLLEIVRNRPAEATEVFSRLEPTRQRDPLVAVPWIDALQMAGQAEAAEKLALDVLRQNPQADTVYDALYALYVKSRRLPDAEALLRRKIAALPAENRPYLQLAAFHLGSGQPAQAHAVADELLSRQKTPLARTLAAELYASYNDLPRAERILEDGVSQGIDPVILRAKQAFLLLNAGQLPRASAAIDSALAKSPNDPTLKFLRASIAAESATPSERPALIKDLRELAQQLPRDPAPATVLARVLAANGEDAAARQAIAAALQRDAQFVPALIAYARLQAAAGDFENARRAVEEVQRLRPSFPEAEILSVEIDVTQGQFAAARSAIDAILKRDPNRLDALRALGGLELARNRPADALEAYVRLERAAAPPALALQGQASALLALKRPEEALNRIQSALARQPNDPQLRNLLATTALRAGNAALAETQFTALAAEFPRSTEVRLALAQARAALGKFDEAHQAAQEARQFDPANPAVLAMSGDLFARQQRYPEALEIYRGLAKTQPKNARVRNNVAYAILESKGDLNEALGHATEAVALAPNEPSYLETLGNIYLKKGATDPGAAAQAVSTFQNLVAKTPNTPYHRYLLAIALEQSNDAPAALREYQAALKLPLSPAVAADARDRVAKLKSAQ